jgi:hypothetical protein
MNEADTLDIMQFAIWTVLTAAGPAVAVAMLVGIVIALIQVQDIILTSREPDRGDPNRSRCGLPHRRPDLALFQRQFPAHRAGVLRGEGTSSISP